MEERAGEVRLTPPATNPNIMASVPGPARSDPDCARMRPYCPSSPDPDPTAVPSPISRGPGVLRTGRDRDDLGLRRRGRASRIRRWCHGRSLHRGAGVHGRPGRGRWRRGSVGWLIGRHIHHPSLDAPCSQQQNAGYSKHETCFIPLGHIHNHHDVQIWFFGRRPAKLISDKTRLNKAKPCNFSDEAVVSFHLACASSGGF
jgi:hypothetical protein